MKSNAERRDDDDDDDDKEARDGNELIFISGAFPNITLRWWVTSSYKKQTTPRSGLGDFSVGALYTFESETTASSVQSP